MKTLRVPFGLFVFTVGVAFAQEPNAPFAAVSGSPTAGGAIRTAAEFEQLVGPIALYPDALIALILPATTAPADIVLAARHVREFPNDRSQIEHRAWDESVKSLTHYPDVLKWMDENLHWTKQVGEAFATQPADVMQAVQRLRAKARAVGTLVDTPQQQVIAEPQVIRIVPTQPDVIYVPQYQPEIVFVDRPVYYSQPFITFGIGYPVGSWLAFDCDWRRHTIWVGNRHRHWNHHNWHRPLVPFAGSHGHTHNSPSRAWRPPPQPPRHAYSVAWTRPTEVARPSPFGSTSTRSHGPRGSGSATFVEHRRGETHSLPVSNPQPRTYSSTRRDFPAPNSTPTTIGPGIVMQPLPTARGHASPAVTTTPPVVDRSNGSNGWSHARDTRTRTTQAPTIHSAPAAPRVTTPPAIANRPTGNNGWSHHRDTRTHSAQAPVIHHAPPAVTRSAPVAPRSQPALIAPPAATQGPRVLHSHSTPPAVVYSSPVPAPSRSAHVASSAPVVSAPAAPAAIAPAAPGGPRVDPGGERHHGRRNEN